MASDRAVTRRRYDDDLKAQVVAECGAPGASVAKVAMSHGINANVVHRWRQLAREARVPASAPTSEFVAVSLAPPRGQWNNRLLFAFRWPLPGWRSGSSPTNKVDTALSWTVRHCRTAEDRNVPVLQSLVAGPDQLRRAD
jgi:hypothetical protein